MLAKLNVPANSEVGPMAAMIGAARGNGKEEWELESGAIFRMSHTRAGITVYKKASPRTTVEAADGNILLVDGFGTIEVNLDQPGSTTKPVRMSAVAYISRLSRNLMSTLKSIGSKVVNRLYAT